MPVTTGISLFSVLFSIYVLAIDACYYFQFSCSPLLSVFVLKRHIFNFESDSKTERNGTEAIPELLVCIP